MFRSRFTGQCASLALVAVASFLFSNLTPVGPGSAAAAESDTDYATARRQVVEMAESLDSYAVEGTLRMTNRVKDAGDGQETVATMSAAARWPDRLRSSQTGDMVALNLGSGPEQSWFYLGQLGNAYIGPPAKLTRDLASAGQIDLTPDRIFNFYGGLGPYLLPADLAVVAGVETAPVVANGREIACQVFRTEGSAETPGDQPVEGPRTIYFDPVSRLVLKSELTVYFRRQGVDYAQDVAFELNNFQLNGEVDDARFEFEAPSRTRIVNDLDLLTNPDAMTGQTAPDIAFTDLEGNTFRLSELRGQPVFIDFWATWCGPCKMEMPHIETLYHELGQDGSARSDRIRIIAASNEDPRKIRSYLRQKPYSFQIVTVDGTESHRLYKTNSIPAGFVIDADGVIRAHMVGAQSEKQLRAAFAKVGVK